MIIASICIDHNCFHFFCRKISSEWAETENCQLEALNAEGNPHNGQHQEAPRQHGLNGQYPTGCNSPHNIQKTIATSHAAAPAFVLNEIMSVDNCFSKRKQQKYGDLDNLPATGKSDTSGTEHQTGEKPSQE